MDTVSSDGIQVEVDRHSREGGNPACRHGYFAAYRDPRLRGDDGARDEWTGSLLRSPVAMHSIPLLRNRGGVRVPSLRPPNDLPSAILERQLLRDLSRFAPPFEGGTRPFVFRKCLSHACSVMPFPLCSLRSWWFPPAQRFSTARDVMCPVRTQAVHPSPARRVGTRDRRSTRRTPPNRGSRRHPRRPPRGGDHGRLL